MAKSAKELTKYQMGMIKGLGQLGYSTERIADEVGCFDTVVTYNLKRMRELQEAPVKFARERKRRTIESQDVLVSC